MPTDSEPTTTEERLPANTAVVPKKKKKKKPKIARPLEEHEINAPDIQTLLMMGSLAALAVVLWIFAHAGCNYHPPRETRVPRKVSLADLTREPKDAAIELQQRLATLDYKGALEIAAGPLAKEIEAEKAACDKDRAACDARKVKAEKAISLGVVLARDPMSAKVRVITHRLPDGVKRYLTLVERDPSGWKITARIPDVPGAELPPPSIAPSMRFTTPPHGGPAGELPPGATPPGVTPPGAKPAAPTNTPPTPGVKPPGHP